MHSRDQLIDVWMSMADHFLDTETRQDIPITALRCVEAGLSTTQAREVWRHQVSPVVGFNLLMVAGEWAGWDRDWLVEKIEALGPRGPLRRLGDRLGGSLLGGVWTSIERCMGAVLELPSPEGRVQRAQDLAALARHAFDFVPNPLDSERLRRLLALGEGVYDLLSSAMVSGEGKAAKERVRAALGLAS